MIGLLDRLGGARSLQLRFMLTVLLGALVVALLSAGAAFFIGKQRARIITMQAIDGLVAAVESSAAIGAYARDGVLLGELVEGLLRNDTVRSVEVIEPGGQVLARAGPMPLDAAAGPIVERRLVSPFDAKETVATLRLNADGRFIAATAWRETAILGGFMGIELLVMAVLLYATAAWLVSGPIVRLARALPAMVPGTAQRLRKPAAHRHDEIGLLVDGANQLLEAHGSALRRERGLRAELEAMEAQYRQIFDSSSAGIFVLDARHRLINSNPTVSRVVGMSPDRLKALRHDNFIERVFGDPAAVLRMVHEAAERRETVSGDLALLHKSGDSGQAARWVHCLISVQWPPASTSTSTASAQTGTAQKAQPTATIEGVIYDVTERRKAERRTRHRAEHDPLTGLKNRGAIEAVLDRLVDEALDTGSRLTLMCLDLDGFKHVNDQFGHQAGDEVLIACAKAMRATVRVGVDVLGRVGGDEFLVCLQHAGADDAVVMRTAAALIEALRRPIALDGGRQARIGVSIGIACVPVHAGDRATLVAAADEALYDVKRGGKNSYAMAAARQADRRRSSALPKARPAPVDTGLLQTNL